MTLKGVNSFILLIFIAYCSYYLFSRYDWEKEQQIEPDTEQPIFSSKNIKTTSYDAKGIRSYTLISVSLAHFQSRNETYFEKPQLHTFQEGMIEEWRVSADFAILTDKNLLVMQGNVEMNNLLPEAQLQTISTDKVSLDLTSRDFWTDTETRIFGINFTTRGDSAKGNFNSHSMELIEKVKSIYETKIN